MKKLLATLFACTIFCTSLCACGEPPSSPVEDFSYEFDDGTVIITGYHGSDLDIVVPSVIDDRPVTIIGEEAFRDYDMNSVHLPDTITIIGYQAFYSCSNLKSVNIPDSVTDIHKYAFGWCESLEEVEIPSSVISIGYSFDNCAENFTIYGRAGSYAEEYAKDNNINFIKK